ncbi:unnamed protein product [Chrysoparadoxa australica]
MPRLLNYAALGAVIALGPVCSFIIGARPLAGWAAPAGDRGGKFDIEGAGRWGQAKTSIPVAVTKDQEVIKVPPKPGNVAELKADLLDTLFVEVDSSYYHRHRDSRKKVAEVVSALEEAQQMEISFPSAYPDLDGRWKMLYSSSMLGLTKISPLRLDEVYQTIDVAENNVANTVYGTIRPPLFAEAWGKFPVKSIGDLALGINGRVSFGVDFTLNHSFAISSESHPAELKISAHDLKLFGSENPSSKQITLPAIRPLAKALAGKMEVPTTSPRRMCMQHVAVPTSLYPAYLQPMHLFQRLKPQACGAPAPLSPCAPTQAQAYPSVCFSSRTLSLTCPHWDLTSLSSIQPQSTALFFFTLTLVSPPRTPR